MTLPLRPELADVHAYGAPQDAVAVRLNVNENPFPPSPDLCRAIGQAVAEAAAGMNRYPDRDFTALRAKLAAYLNRESSVSLTAEQIWAGNGSNEVMLHLLQAYGGHGRLVIATAPSYSMYPEYARDTGTDYLAVARRPDFEVDLPALRQQIIDNHPAVVLIPSPNNPTGTALTIADIVTLAETCRGSGPRLSPDGTSQPTDTVLVIDEAYGEFRPAHTPSALTLLERFPHLVVCRTMSKAFGAAGLRLGYLAAAPNLVADLMKVRLPYHLSALTQAAAITALDFQDQLADQVAYLRQQRDHLVAALSEMGFKVAPTSANFVMFGQFPDRDLIFNELRRRSILIRQVGPEGWLRVSVGTAAENETFLTALREITCPN